jgi:hypothetical protein
MDKIEDQDSAKHQESSLASESTIFAAAGPTERPQNLLDLENETDYETTSDDVGG